jgi:ABC-2 type transport system permease protein
MTAYFLTDSTTMLRRSMRRMRRYPSLTLFIAGIPVVVLLLFVYVLGGTLGAGLGLPAGGRDQYIAYVIPGILLLTVVGAGQGTAISVAMDMSAGIVARFRTMAIARGAVLAGHVLGSVIQTMLALVVVLVVAVLVGFRPTTGPLEWLAAVGLLALAGLAVSWFSVALGMVTDSVETASNLPMFLLLLLFLSSAFVPTSSLPDPLRWFAEVQPFTPIVETLRAPRQYTPLWRNGPVAVGWRRDIGPGAAGCMSACRSGWSLRRALSRRTAVRPALRHRAGHQHESARLGSDTANAPLARVTRCRIAGAAPVCADVRLALEHPDEGKKLGSILAEVTPSASSTSRMSAAVPSSTADPASVRTICCHRGGSVRPAPDDRRVGSLCSRCGPGSPRTGRCEIRRSSLAKLSAPMFGVVNATPGVD